MKVSIIFKACGGNYAPKVDDVFSDRTKAYDVLLSHGLPDKFGRVRVEDKNSGTITTRWVETYEVL